MNIPAPYIYIRNSDGSGTVEEIAKSAEDSGLDFMILTDHNTLKAKDKGYEKWYGEYDAYSRL